MSRFSDARGRGVPLRRLPNGLRSLWQVFRRRCFGVYPELPWIPFEAITRLDRIVDRESLVWEVGAGMSTLWLSRRAKWVVSIEADQAWHGKLRAMLAARNIKNVDLRFEWVAQRMAALPTIEDHSLDLLIVDGGPRTECLKGAFGKVKPAGHIYLDNWDVPAVWPEADNFLRAHSQEILSRESIVDYVPGNFAVNEGLLIQKTGP